MADVIKKIISGNDIRHGGATTGVPGNPTHTILPNIFGGATVSEIENNLTNRFDDTDYYGTLFKPTIVSGCVVWAAADKETSFSDGDAVATWTNQTVKSYDFSQPTAAKKPTYRTNIMNGKPALLFDGTDDYMSIVMGTELSDLTDFTLMMVIKYVSLSAYVTPASFGPNVFSYPQLRMFQLDNDSPVENIRTEGKDGSNVVVTLATDGDAIADTSYVMTFHNDADGSGVQYKNMIESGSGTGYNNLSYKDGSYDIVESTIGAAHDPTNYANIYLSEYVLYDRLLSLSEKSRIEKYLSKKYGVPMP
tara:strand:+ start:3626 stop:4543 length:918 start_codon:yes stop_codon:yes gene_type:complete